MPSAFVSPAEISPSREGKEAEIVARGLAPRHRSILDLIAGLKVASMALEMRIYPAEAVPPWALQMRSRYARFIGSEYCRSPERMACIYPIEHRIWLG